MDTTRTKTSDAAFAVDRLLSVPAAQRQLGVSRSKLYQMIETGEVPRPVKLGRRTFFSERELQSWIEALLARREAGGAR